MRPPRRASCSAPAAPNRGEYQPRGGSVSPRCADHSSARAAGGRGGARRPPGPGQLGDGRRARRSRRGRGATHPLRCSRPPVSVGDGERAARRRRAPPRGRGTAPRRGARTPCGGPPRPVAGRGPGRTPSTTASACSVHRNGPPARDWSSPSISTVLWPGSSGSSSATRARRGSSRCPGRPARRRRRAAPRPTARRRGRARRSRGSRAGRRRSGTRSRAPSPAGVRSSAKPGVGEVDGRPLAAGRSTAARPARARRATRLRTRRCDRAATRQAPKTAARRGRAAPAHGSASGSSTTSARPSSPSPWRGARPVASTRAAAASSMRAAARQVAVGQRVTRGVGLDGGDQAELGDEPVVVGGELAVDAAGEGVGAAARARSCAAASARQRVALGEPGEGAGGDEPAGRLGDHVVVRRRARGCGTPRDSCWCHQIWRSASALSSNRSADPRPVVEQPPDPGPARSAARRARSRSSSARRTGTGSPPTTTAAGAATTSA